MIPFLTATELREHFYSGNLTAVQITEAFLKHIAQHDPKIGAFLSVYTESALQQAKKLDEKRSKGGFLGKLAAVPVALKDIIHKKGEITTCGSKFLVNYRAGFDATVTRLLEEEDAIIIGKTNMDEFAMGSSTEHSAYKLTRNPWDLRSVPGGSSGGSAAAVAACMSPLSLGTDTGGSIRQPASLCGVVGFKPTYGRVSRYGVVAYASSLDHVGPFARTVHDLAIAMEVIGRPCPFDSTCLPKQGVEYSRERTWGLNSMKIAVPWHFLDGLDKPTFENFKSSIEQLKDLGAEIIDVNLDILKYSIPVYYILATAEASTNLARFDGIHYGVRSSEAKTLQEVYEFSKEEGFGREVKRRLLLGTYVLSSSKKELFFKKAQQVRACVVRDFARIFEKADLIAMPTSPSPAFKIGAVLDPLQMYLADIYTIGANLAGIPAINLPSGFDSKGLPFGLQLMGAQLNDATVIRAAYAFEKASNLPQYPGNLKS